MKSSFVKLLVAASLLLVQFSTLAFTPKTHVWVGQEVINDLQDGKLTFNLDGQIVHIPVRTEIVNAILANQKEFRMGQIGPDAVPDFITGQSLIHPGVTGGWQHDQWVKWIVDNSSDPKEIAFAYGTLGHTASDVFAHSYVNLYAGEAWDLGDNEHRAELRHYLIEAMIDEHLPPFRNANGQYMGTADQLIEVPSNFIVNELILNDEVSAQYNLGNANHLYLVHQLRKEIRRVLDGPLAQIERDWVREFIEYYYGTSISDDEAGQIISLLSAISAAVGERIDDLQDIRDANFSNLYTIVEFQQDLAALANGASQLARYNRLLVEAAEEIEQLESELESIPRRIRKAIRKCGLLACQVIYRWVDNPLWVTKNSLLVSWVNERASLQEDFDRIENETIELLEEIEQGRLNGVALTQHLVNIAIDTIQVYTDSLHPLRGHLENWEIDIETGMVAYVDSSKLFMQKIIQGNGQAGLNAYRTWLDCYGSSVLGSIPSVVTSSGCELDERMQAINENLEQLVDELGAWTPIGRLKQEIQNRIEAKALEAVEKFVEEVYGTDLATFANIVTNLNDQALIFAFNGPSQVGLLEIPDVEARLLADMSVNSLGHFNKNRFYSIYNSIVLAKLSLLDQGGLNQLAAHAGIQSPTVYGNRLYGDAGNDGDNNILFQAVRNIDGNHQWLETSPPLPRRQGYFDFKWPEDRRSGYSASNLKGMRIFQDNQARNKVFRRLFKGTLSTSLESPEERYQLPILPQDYAYRSCSDYPFPDGVESTPCPQRPLPADIEPPNPEQPPGPGPGIPDIDEL